MHDEILETSRIGTMGFQSNILYPETSASIEARNVRADVRGDLGLPDAPSLEGWGIAFSNQ
jgi:hypothetical protein